MTAADDDNAVTIPDQLRQSGTAVPSPRVVRFSEKIRPGGQVLDLACGGGRHGRYLLALGYRVLMVDRDISHVADLAGQATTELIAHDLEDGSPWPFAGRQFDGIVVTNCLYRPVMRRITTALAPGGVLFYETFADGNHIFGRPRNPGYLLRGDELLDTVRPGLRVVAYEDIAITDPRPAAVQRIVTVRSP